MGNRTKQRRSGGLSLQLFSRTLHPEFFKILKQEPVTRRAYQADIWIVEGGHVVSFTANHSTLTEVVAPKNETLGDRGLLQSIPCRGERYHETDAPGGLKYMISTQEEQLTQTLFEATRHETVSYAQRRELLMAEVPATAESGFVLSVLDIERRSHELLVQSFHLFEESLLVIKTQGIFEVAKTR